MQLFALVAAERAARCGEDESVDFCVGSGGERLREGGVFGVDGHHGGVQGGCVDGGAYERAARDEGFLVSQCHSVAAVEGGEGRLQADGAGDAVEDGVCRVCCGLYGGFGAVGDLRGVAGDAGFRGCRFDEFAEALRVGGGAAGGDQFGAHVHCLACEQFEGSGACGEGDDLQWCVGGGGAGAFECGEVVDDFHGLGADGAG